MTSIVTQKDCRSVRDLPFCYICGRAFLPGERTNYDHLPPKAIFLDADKNFPLKLRTHHDGCHAPLNHDDEVIGQLVSLINGVVPTPENDKLALKIAHHPTSNKTTGIFQARDIGHLLRRWVQGFHAALYKEPLGANSKWAIQAPFPSGNIIPTGLAINPILPQYLAFVECIKKNRKAGTIDRIATNNGKMRYECVWDTLNDGSPCCVFALDVYGWAELGDINHFQRRGCIGLYQPASNSLPLGATRVTSIEVPIHQRERADPFSD